MASKPGNTKDIKTYPDGLSGFATSSTISKRPNTDIASWLTFTQVVNFLNPAGKKIPLAEVLVAKRSLDEENYGFHLAGFATSSLLPKRPNTGK